ncbi:MAG: alpha/beta hydrolase-fold protein, partial [Bacteroidaceae bacterium]
MNTNYKLLFFFIALFFGISGLQAARIDSIEVYSQKSNQHIKVFVFVPETKMPKPTWYLLHGYSGNEKDWYNHRKDLPKLADQYQMLIVCPDAKNSWYWDSPLNKNSQYETFMSKELIRYIDSHYATIPDSKHRAISGLS